MPKAASFATVRRCGRRNWSGALTRFPGGSTAFSSVATTFATLPMPSCKPAAISKLSSSMAPPPKRRTSTTPATRCFLPTAHCSANRSLSSRSVRPTGSADHRPPNFRCSGARGARPTRSLPPIPSPIDPHVYRHLHRPSQRLRSWHESGRKADPRPRPPRGTASARRR